MKSKLTLALAASILTLTLGAFPHQASAAASSTTTTPTVPEYAKPIGCKPVKYMYLAVDILLSALLP